MGWQEKEIIRAKFPTMQKADVIGWFDGDTLVSQVAVYPMRVKVFGKTYSMGGLTGVGTYPEYSNMGLMHKAAGAGPEKHEGRKSSISAISTPIRSPITGERAGN